MPLFILAIVVTMLVADGLWWWRTDRAVRAMPAARGWRLTVAAFGLIQILSLLWIIFGRALGGRGDEALPTFLVIAVYIWHFLVLMGTLMLWALGSVAWLSTRPFVRASAPAATETPSDDVPAAAAQPVPSPAADAAEDEEAAPTLVHRVGVGTVLVPPPPRPQVYDGDDALDDVQGRRRGGVPLTRRQLLGAAAAMVPPLVTVVATGVALPQLSWFRVRRIDVPLTTLPAALDGLTIAQVSDTHVGRFTRGPVLDEIVRQTNALKPDLVLLTGDLINHAHADIPEAMAMVRQLRGRYGEAMCEGNHDLFEGRRAFERAVKDAGGNLLVNTSTTVTINRQRVQLLGLQWGAGLAGATRGDDRSDEAIRASLNQLLRQLKPDAFPILLAHHPHAFDPAAEAGIPLTLAGHTHGGQFMLTPNLGFGPWMFRYWSGLYTMPNRTAACVVSNGVGNWFPLRTNAPAEIVHLTLRRVTSA